MIKLLYVGYYIDDAEFEGMIRNGLESSPARQNFESRLLHEIQRIIPQDDWEIVSYLPTNTTDGETGSSLGNKHITAYRIARNPISCLRNLIAFRRFLIKSDIKNCSVLMYSVHPVLSIPLFLMRKKLNLRLITICSEIPKYRPAGHKIKLPRKIEIAFQTFLNKRMDAYVLFSEPMKEEIPVRNKPNTVVEGIAPEGVCLPLCHKENIVMYAGGFGEQNNLRILIDACEKSSLVSKLWLCGSGDLLDYIQQRVSEKVCYLGNLSREDVFQRERNAKVLVNIRDPHILVTKYSFPSKILEYIAAGALVVSSNLEGIPEEYFKYIHKIDEITVDSVKTTIDSVLSMDDRTLYEKCRDAQIWVSRSKNVSVQTEKILSLCLEYN